MLVATFSTDTAWAGRRISHEDGRFVLEAFGVITAAQVLEYDAATPLCWTTEGTRVWVRSVAHREGAATPGVAVPVGEGSGGNVTSATGAGATGAGVTAPEAGRPGGDSPGRPAGSQAARTAVCHFSHAHYVGGQPSLGPAVEGAVHGTAEALVLQPPGGAPGVTLPFGDVLSVGLFGARATDAGLVEAVSTGAGSPGAGAADERTFIVAHLRPSGYAAFAVDGAAPDAVRRELGPVLDQAGVPLQGHAPAGGQTGLMDEVRRLAELRAGGALTDDEFRAELGSVFARTADEGAGTARTAGSAVRVPQAAKEAALERLSKLRLSGAISDEELSAMRAKLLE